MTFHHPKTRTVDAFEDVAGVRLPDPYRWLEDGDSEEVRLWDKHQGELAASHVRDWPHFAAVRALVDRYAIDAIPAIPRFAGGKWFREYVPDGGTVAKLVVADEPFGSGRAVIDLADFREGGEARYLSWFSPSPDGSVLAIGIRSEGSEQHTIRLVDVATGEVRDDAPPQLIYDAFTGGVVWLPDSSGFFYFALTGPAAEFNQAVFLHLLGEPAPTSPEAIPRPDASAQAFSDKHDKDYTLIQVSPDGRWAVAAHRLLNPIPVAIRDLSDPGSSWRPFVTKISGTVAGYVMGDRYVAVTDVGAPRGRVVAIPLDSADPNDTGTWVELVPESGPVLRGVTRVQDLLYVIEIEDTYTKVRIIDQDGGYVGHVPLPGRGTLLPIVDLFPFRILVGRGHPDEFLFTFSSLTSSWGVYRHRPGESAVDELLAPAVTLDDACIEDRFATSADGTQVPYHVVRLASLDARTPQPTLMRVYGGFNLPLLPDYNPTAAVFVAAGGVFVHAHLRGGGEYGREWWEAGRLKAKQNSYADMYAVAEDLLARGETTPELLGLTGGSLGGITATVAVTQRPELWRVVVPRFTLTDLIGGLRDTYSGLAIRGEFADPDGSDELHRLLAISPYHLIRPGTQYPAVLIDAGDGDSRVPAWHVRKWGARMQAAQAGEAPILIQIRENMGHNPPPLAQRETTVVQLTETNAFIMRHLNMDLET